MMSRVSGAVGLAFASLLCGCSPPPATPLQGSSVVSTASAAASVAPSSPSLGTTLTPRNLDSEDWSPDGRYVVVDRAIVDLDSGEVLPSACEEAVVWGTGSRVACKTGSKPRRVEVVDVATHRRGHLEGCDRAEIQWSRTGRYVGCAGVAGLFDADTFEAVPLPSPLMWQGFVGDGSVVRLQSDPASSDVFQGSVQLWNVSDRVALGDPYSFPLVHARSTSLDGRFELELLGEEALLVDLRRGAHVHVASGVTQFAHAVPESLLSLFSADSALVAVPIETEGVRLVDTATAADRGTLRGAGCDAPTQAAFGPRGDLVAVGTRNGRVCMFDRASQTLLRSWTVTPPPPLGPPQPSTPQVVLLAFAGGGDGLIVGVDTGAGPSGSSFAALYDVDTGKRLSDLAGGSVATRVRQDASGTVWLDGATVGPRLEVKILPAGFADSSRDGKWACKGDHVESDGLPIPVFEAAAGATFVSCDPTGTKVLGTAGGRARVWSLQTGRSIYAP